MKSKGTIPARERKNGASREQWEKRKQAANAARGKQQFVVLNDDSASGVYDGYWVRGERG